MKTLKFSKVISLNSYSRYVARTKISEYVSSVNDILESFNGFGIEIGNVTKSVIVPHFLSHSHGNGIKVTFSIEVSGSKTKINSLKDKIEKISDPQDIFDKWGWNI